MIPERAQAILDFWFKETPSEMRFKKDEKFDQKIKDNFLKDYELACQNAVSYTHLTLPTILRV